jgi:hypothetical protein
MDLPQRGWVTIYLTTLGYIHSDVWHEVFKIQFKVLFQSVPGKTGKTPKLRITKTPKYSIFIISMHKNCWDNQIKEEETGSTYSTHGDTQNGYNIFASKSERNKLGGKVSWIQVAQGKIQ